MTQWLYDPGWRAFVRWVDGTQQVIYEESVVANTQWATAQGLGFDERYHAKADPAPGCYNGMSGPNSTFGAQRPTSRTIRP